jgi:FdhD protein
VGFLLTEGLIDGSADVAHVSYCEDLAPEEQRSNVVTVRLSRPCDPLAVQRNFCATSSCGICGKASLEQVAVRCAPVAPGPVVSRSALLAMPQALRGGQRVFEETGGLHGAGLFAPDGRMRAVREDVGRHNAVDKLVGRAVLAAELPLSDVVLFVSGRVSFEVVQKAAVAGIPVVAAVSAPSSLAVEAAASLGMTMAGFVRGSGFNVYTCPERIAAT